uniref:Uncharacterized protein n=1 Tax=Lotharella oceanica TaxID=641309 RepID=A0A7S2TGN8_9EUKA|mmetsp:Transcript_13411/g.25620  ORF Transcript_13411/g.25620 Transcript_13411/m.25620 type:complete len:236 (+) Transcript_13411:74-781(+)
MFLEKTVGSPIVGHSIAGPIEKGYLSWPQVGKHVSFDGRWLHGAPEELTHAFPPVLKESVSGDRIKTGETKSTKQRNPAKSKRQQGKRSRKSIARLKSSSQRITFLVNVWLNHKPEYAKRMGCHLQRKLSPALHRAPIQFREHKFEELKQNSFPNGNSGGKSSLKLTWPIAQSTTRPADVSLLLPNSARVSVVSGGVMVASGYGCLALNFRKSEAQVLERRCSKRLRATGGKMQE